MSTLFLSHAAADAAAAARLHRWLGENGHESVFLDVHPHDGLSAGVDWEAELYARVRRCRAVVFLASPASLRSRWCFAEIALARSQGKPVVPVALAPVERHPLLNGVQYVEPRRGRVDRGRLLAELGRLGLHPADRFRWDPRRPPYPGLAAFAEEDAAVFYGRDAEIGELLRKVEAGPSVPGRLVTVVGPSGSGKSSLVHAGLLPELRRRGGWLVVPTVRPRGAPLDELARSLALAMRAAGRPADPRELAVEIEATGRLAALARDLQDTAGAGCRSVLLVIDALEELLSQPDRGEDVAGADRAAAFLDAVRRALVEPGSPLHIVATLRSEFLTPVLRHPAMRGLLHEVVPVGPLARARLPAVIEKPAARAGLELESGLAARMVDETGGGDALPLLSFTLELLYRSVGPDGRLTEAAYREIGGVAGALRRKADDARDELEARGLGASVLPTLLRMVSLDADQAPVRRGVRLDEVGASEHDVLETFMAKRLLKSTATDDAVIVEPAHEALLRQWPPLREAIEERRSDLRLRSELERAARDWIASGRLDAYLLRDERLAMARRWLGSDGAAAHLPEVRVLVEESTRRDRAALEAAADALAVRVLRDFGEDPERGVLLALAAIEEYAPTARARSALCTTLAASQVRGYLRHPGRVSSVSYSPESDRIVTACADGILRSWSARTLELEAQWEAHPSGVELARYGRGGGTILTAPARGPARLWEGDGSLRSEFVGHRQRIWSGDVSPCGRLVVTASYDCTARVWEADSGRELAVLVHPSRVRDAAFTPDGRRIATACDDGVVRLWDPAAPGEPLAVLLSGIGALRCLSFSPAAPQLACGGMSGLLHVVDYDGGGRTLAVRAHDETIESVAFSPDGERIVTAAWDHSARIWEAASGGLVMVAAGHDHSGVRACFLSSDRIVTASDDRTARLWKVRPGVAQLLRRPGRLWSGSFSSGGRQVAIASHDRSIRVWDAATAQLVREVPMGSEVIRSVVYSPDGRWLASGSDDGEVAIRDVETGVLLRRETPVETPVWGLAFSQDCTRLAWGAPDGTARLWTLDGSEELRSFAHEGTVWSATFSPDGTRLVTADDSGLVRVWELQGGTVERVLEGHTAPAGSSFWSRDGRRIVACSDDGTVRVWDAATGEPLHVLNGRAGSALAANFSPDGQWVVGGFADGQARLWHLGRGGEPRLLSGHTALVIYVQFSDDGRKVLTCSFDRTARIWDAATGEVLSILGDSRDPGWTPPSIAERDVHAEDRELLPLTRLARRRVFRTLSAEERARYGLPPLADAEDTW